MINIYDLLVVANHGTITLCIQEISKKRSSQRLLGTYVLISICVVFQFT